MSLRAIEARDGKGSEAVTVGRILLGAVGGAALGMLVGGVVFNSLIVGLFTALAGAIGGMIGPAQAAEG